MYKIYNENCLDRLKKIEDNSVDLVLIDPPYKLIQGGRNTMKGQPKGVLNRNNINIFKHNDIELKEYISELYRVLKDNTHCYIFINFINLKDAMEEAEKAGFKLHTLLVWKKNNKTPCQWYMKNQEYILFMRKGKAKPVKDGGIGHILEFNNILKTKKHPTEKPVDLLELLINNSSEEGDTVLDCFMGSASTGIACINTGRNFIGIEIDPQYFEISEKRLEDHWREHCEKYV